MLDPDSTSAIAILHTGVGTRSNTRDKLSAQRTFIYQEAPDLTGRSAGTVTIY
jgi:hypothetical protein